MADNKNLGDDLDDMLDDTNYNREEYTNTTRRKANEFSEDAKRAAHQFEKDVTTVSKDGKNIALIAHITLIGWIIALVMNNTTKSEFGSFYIRQVLGLGLCMLILNFIPILGWILSLGVVVLWVLSLIGAFNGEKKLTPIVGPYFQDWFKSL